MSEIVTGAIKWYDPKKGYGFVSADDGGSDVLIHVTRLRRDGHETAAIGSRVKVEASGEPTRRRAVFIISLERPKDNTEGKWEEVTVRWFNFLRGYGFLERDAGGPGIFVHATVMRASSMTELRPRQVIRAICEDSENGPVARKIAPM